jgi:hypothetical protein
MLKLGICGKIHQKYLESFEMWCWRRTKQISCAELMRNEEVLQTGKEMNILQTITRNEERLTGLVTSSVQIAF